MEINKGLIKINLDDAFIGGDEIKAVSEQAVKCHETVINKSGKGNDFLGWVDLPSAITEEEIKAIEETAYYLRRKSRLIVSVGIGGSYLGARAVTTALGHAFKPLLKKKNRYPEVIYAGQNIGEDYHSELIEALNDKKYSIIVISKSGTTTEPAVAFRILKNHIEKKYGREVAATRIVAVTDRQKGALKKLAGKEGYKTFVIPDDVGGRFSVLTPVGLLPIAAAGFDIRKMLEGAKEMEEMLKSSASPEENPAVLYAAARNILYRRGKNIEILASYTPSLNYLIEWWKQLYGESEGKDGKGIFPAGVNFTTDLHSIGQMIQAGVRNIFETILWVDKSHSTLAVPEDAANLDELNYISGKQLHEVNEKAMLGTVMAHIDGGVPNIKLSIPELNEKTLGALMYFFEFACAVSGYMLDVNPFDQPGVEAYKRNMFKLLGKF